MTDFRFNLMPGFDKDEQLRIAAGLLGGNGNLGTNLARGLLDAANYRSGRAERDLEKIKLQQLRQAMEQDQQRKQLAQQAFAPGQEVQGPMPDGVSSTMAGQGGGLPEYVRGLMAINPGEAISMQGHLAQMNAKNFQKLGEGESLYDLSNPARPIATGAPKLPAGMRMGPNGPEYIPEYLRGQQEIRAAGRPQTSVTVQGDKAFTTELAKLDAKQLDEFRDSAVKAQGGLSRIAEMKRLSDQGVYSGWAAQGRTGVANFFTTIGAPMDPRKLQNSQEYLKHAKELTLAMLKEGVGSTQISNADREFIDATIPQLETNPQARMNLLNYMEQRLGSSVQRFQDADAYARKNSGLGGFNYQPQQRQSQRPSGPLQKNLTAIAKAKQAIKAGKNREAVIEHLRSEGYDPAGL